MIKYELESNNGKLNSEMKAERLTAPEAEAFFKSLGISVGNLLKELPRDNAIACLDELLGGLEDAKTQTNN